ncbi:GGDEF domain-containing protein [Pseudaminobacter sp. 19-2017]|uniref:diguanylate cyclase n=1 Tax=Pseudaminobacter soli (ex Zhang et al. 2022) TaxID=2831468 RepID=A0A942E6R0_9HYPH|nr:GGDEF domain-containing protein [Pseudaminobacter soli]MBS3649467.1 GGDEF domain-containing protein [Pseudaminobacter soli]
MHVFNWTLAYACATLGTSLDFARIVLANPTPFSFVANLLLVGVAFFAVRGAVLRYAGHSFDRILIPVFLATVVCGIWFVFIDPSIFGRGATSSAGAAAMFLIGAWTIAKAARQDAIDRLLFATFALTAATLIARPIVTYVYEGPLQAEAEVAGSLWVVSFKVFAMLSWFATAILFLLRITTDVMKDLAAQSLTDPLTGILNRRGFFIVAEPVLRDVRPGLPAVLLILDIDQFKRVNDTFGHLTGDNVIQGLANLLRQASKDSGCIIGRLGGEEFVALLPATNLIAGRAFAEGLRAAFAAGSHEGVPFSHTVTVSIGVAESPGGESIDSVIERADGALYRAKREGRNRTHIASDEASPGVVPQGTATGTCRQASMAFRQSMP